MPLSDLARSSEGKRGQAPFVPSTLRAVPANGTQRVPGPLFPGIPQGHLDLSRHPCFNDAARHTFARIHLPVAPECNVQCNFCKRIYDCANESRPGVTSAVLTPPQAAEIPRQRAPARPADRRGGNCRAGRPASPRPSAPWKLCRWVRRSHPEMILCVASNGLNVAPYADELAALEVSHVTLTVNAVDPGNRRQHLRLGPPRANGFTAARPAPNCCGIARRKPSAR